MAKKFYGANVLKSTVGLTEADWLQFRRLGIGGSDVGSIAGVSQFGTPLSVYLDKTEGGLKKVGRSAQWGKWMEDPIARDAASRLGLKTRKVNAMLYHPERPWMMANIDRLICKPYLAIHEIKMIVDRDRANKIKKSLEDGLPKPLPEHECQVRWYMAVTGIDRALITYEMAHGDPIDIPLERDLEMEQHLIDICFDFWQLVESRTPPAMDGSETADDFLQTRFSDSVASVIELDAGAQFLLDQYIRSKEIIDQQEKIRAMARQNLEALMGLNETAKVGSNVITWKPQETSRFDSKKFQSDHPQMYDTYKKSSSQRVFRVR